LGEIERTKIEREGKRVKGGIRGQLRKGASARVKLEKEKWTKMAIGALQGGRRGEMVCGKVRKMGKTGGLRGEKGTFRGKG